MRRNKEGGEREEGLAGMTPPARSTRQKNKHATRTKQYTTTRHSATSRHSASAAQNIYNGQHHTAYPLHNHGSPSNPASEQAG